ncbi:MAG: DUF2007 domain-containing protein [Chloroflexi bacterium]|nr:DUF2007 domain-containing protein [Chloroflexota bacterium]
MTEKNIVAMHVCEGQIEANIFKSLLEAHGIATLLSQEAAGMVYGLGVGDLGRVEIYVAEAQAVEARALLEAYFSGELETAGDEDLPLADE